jgi:hypothetical protein
MSYFNKFPKTGYDFFGNNQLTNIPDIFRQVRTVNKRFDSATPYQLYEISDERPDQLSYKLYGKTSYHWTFFIINESLSQGLSGWMMTHDQLQDYIETKYSGHTITQFRGRDDSINKNSISGKYENGTILTGATSGAKAVVVDRAPEVNQLIINYTTDTVFQKGEAISSSDGNYIDGNYEVREYKNSVAYYVDENGDKVSNYENLYLPEKIVTYSEDEEIRNNESRFIRVIRKDYIEEFATEYRRLLNVK